MSDIIDMSGNARMQTLSAGAGAAAGIDVADPNTDPSILEEISETQLTDASKITDVRSYASSDVAYQDGLIKIKGFSNLGNTCYMNAALQALLSSNVINSRIIRYTQEHPEIINDMSPLFLEYVKLIYQLIEDDGQGQDDPNASTASRQAMNRMRNQQVIAPRNFKDVLGKENPMFAGFSQQDSHELILFLLNDMVEIPKRVTERMDDVEKQAAKTLREYRRKEKRSEDEFKGIRKVMRDTYFGTYRQVLECQDCGHITDTIFKHVDIVLPVPRHLVRQNMMARMQGRSMQGQMARYQGKLARNMRLPNGRIVPNPEYSEEAVREFMRLKSMHDAQPSPINITDCFAEYSKLETLDGDSKVDCEKCKIKTPTTKRMELDYVPEVTILTISRFEPHGKIGETVQVYPKIDLDGYRLRLIATVNHVGGSPHGGHYTAHVSRSWYDGTKLNESWFHANDSSVTEIKKEQVLTDPRIYLAIYERMQT